MLDVRQVNNLTYNTELCGHHDDGFSCHRCGLSHEHYLVSPSSRSLYDHARPSRFWLAHSCSASSLIMMSLFEHGSLGVA